MVLVPNPKGGSMEVSSTADAVSKGWSPSMGTFGTSPDGGGGGGGSQQSQGASETDAERKKREQEAQVLAGFKESSGFSREELAEKKREFDQLYAQKEAEWTRQGLPELVIKQQLADLEDAKFRETVQQFKSTQGLEYLKFASTLRGPADFFQSVDFNRGAQQRGDVPSFLNALASNTQMPSFQSAGTVPQQALTAGGLAQGLTGVTVNGQPVAGTPAGQAGYVPAAGVQGGAGSEALKGGVPYVLNGQIVREVKGPTGVQYIQLGPAPAGMADYTPMMAGQVPGAAPLAAGAAPQTTPGGYDSDAALAKIASVFKSGGTGLGVGSLERLDPNELALMKSGADKLGYDYDSWIRQYQKSGVGQSAGVV